MATQHKKPPKAKINLRFFKQMAWVRMLIACLVLYFYVMPETGPWTALFLGALVVAIEAHGVVTDELTATMKTTLHKIIGPTASRVRSLQSRPKKGKRKWS